MNPLEIDAAIIDITNEKCNECKSKLQTVPKENVVERKALQLELGMYTFCGNAGCLFRTIGEREKVFSKRFNLMKKYLQHFPRLNAVFITLDEKEKRTFVAALQAEIFIRDQWLNSHYAELSEAERFGDTERIFELKIKIGAVLTMFKAWEAWRIENNIYPYMLCAEPNGVHNTFYVLATEKLGKECVRLYELTDLLDSSPLEKEIRIIEYKCAKYRYASVSLIDSILHQNYECRNRHNLSNSHYLLRPFETLFKKATDGIIAYDSAAEEEKADTALYYAAQQFVKEEIQKLLQKSAMANDWETIELKERIDGLLFAKQCLCDAWTQRKEFYHERNT